SGRARRSATASASPPARLRRCSARRASSAGPGHGGRVAWLAILQNPGHAQAWRVGPLSGPHRHELMPGMPAFKTIALIGGRNAPDIGAAVLAMADFLKREGCKVLVERQTASSPGLSGLPPADHAEIGERADLAVVLGGDGSMLAAARSLA